MPIATNYTDSLSKGALFTTFTVYFPKFTNDGITIEYTRHFPFAVASLCRFCSHLRLLQHD